MTTKFTRTVLTAIVSVFATSVLFTAAPAFAQGPVREGADAARGTDVPSLIMGDGGVISQVINVMLFIVGVLSVIMLIWGGLRYVISGGNSTSVTAAKNTILYAIVGLLVAIFAYAIINFVIGTATGGSVLGGTSGNGGFGGNNSSDHTMIGQ